MAKVGKITICLGLVALLAILMGMSSAQLMPQPEGPMKPDLAFDSGRHEVWVLHEVGMPFMGVPVEMVVGGGGFALQGSETHLLRLNVERLSPLEPGQIRRLLVSNKSIEEIRDAIKAEEGEEGQALYRGSMRLDDLGYPLTNIDIHPLNDTATFVDADVALPGSNPANQIDKATKMVGHLNMTVFVSKGGRIGEGELEMNSTEHKGSYHILLDMANRAMHFKGMRDYIGPGKQ